MTHGHHSVAGRLRRSVCTAASLLMLTTLSLTALARPSGAVVPLLPPGNPFGNLDTAMAGPDSVTMTGWAIDPDITGPVTVNVYVDGHFTAGVTANIDRPDIQIAYPAYGGFHGFSATVATSVGTHVVCAYALNVGVGNTNTALGCRTVPVGGNPFGNLDAAVAGPDTIAVSGWAIDPDTAAPITVNLYVDGHFTTGLTANVDRPDVGLVHPTFGRAHGFTASLATTAGTHVVCAYAINVDAGTVNTPLGCRTDAIGGNPFGSFEPAVAGPDAISVSGWAIDPDTASSITVNLYVDGLFTTGVTADVSRPDLDAKYGIYGRLHGFADSLATTAGTHVVCAYAINVDAGTVNTPLGCRTVPVGGNPFGHLDSVVGLPGSIVASGWAIDPDVAGPITVNLYLDGHFVTGVTAGVNRPDVGATFPLYGSDHGFTDSLAAATGTHLVCAYAINVDAGNANTPLGCQTVGV